MELWDRTLYLYVDDEQMAGVCLDALLGKSFTVVDAGEGEAGQKLLEGQTLDWVIVDFDLPDEGAAEFIRSSGKFTPNHGFVMLSGQTRGVMAWEKFHGLRDKVRLKEPVDAQAFLSRFAVPA